MFATVITKVYCPWLTFCTCEQNLRGCGDSLLLTIKFNIVMMRVDCGSNAYVLDIHFATTSQMKQ
jgi:hypothetical protein